MAVFPSGSIAHPLCDEVAEGLRRWTANPLCAARVGSNPILVVKGPQGFVLSFSNEHSRGGHFRDYITSVQHLTFPFSMSGCISIYGSERFGAVERKRSEPTIPTQSRRQKEIDR